MESDNGKFESLLSTLNRFQKERIIKQLYRGCSKEFAFNKFKLDTRFNSIEQFEEMLFFFGEKSRYFWNAKLKSSSAYDFELDEASDSFFSFIFREFSRISSERKKYYPEKFLHRNQEVFNFFKIESNIPAFLSAVNLLLPQEKILARNYYLRILHQLGSPLYKGSSHLISGTEEEAIAKQFSRGEIIINFWDLNFRRSLQFNVPKFKGAPYENQREISVFTTILPHFIHSFKFQGKFYINPAVEKINDFEMTALCGFNISQENFKERLIKETNYESGVSTDGVTYKKI